MFNEKMKGNLGAPKVLFDSCFGLFYTHFKLVSLIKPNTSSFKRGPLLHLRTQPSNHGA